MSEPPDELDRLVRNRVSLPNVDKVILVSSGKGGVGKSTVAASLAVSAAQRGLSVGLLDADLFGPSIPQLFDAYEPPRVQQQRMQPVERYGVKLLSIGMLAGESKAFVWRGPVVRGVLRQLFRDTDWGTLDILFVDAPPGTGEILITLLQTVTLAGAVVVTTPHPLSLADARRAAEVLRTLRVPILGVVENMASYSCPSCGDAARLFPGDAGLELSNELDRVPVVSIPMYFGMLSELAASQPPVSSFRTALDQLVDLTVVARRA